MTIPNNPSLTPHFVTLADTNTGPTTAPSVGHIQDLSLTVKGLIRRLEYKYVIEGLGANWPVALVPISGSFIATSKTHNIDVKAIFCPNFVLCPSGSSDVLGYNRNYSYGTEKGLLFSTVRAKVSEIDSTTDFIYSEPKTLSCSNCLPAVGPKITFPASVTLDSATKNSIMVSGVASGISPDTRYSYVFKVLDATWPVELYPLSGTIKSATDVVSVPSQLVFCESAGSYDVDMCGTEKEKRATISLELTPLPENTETVSILSFNDSKIISNDMFAECDDCVPYPKVTLSATPATTNQANKIDIVGNVINLKTNREYEYTLENIDSNWPLYVGSKTGILKPVAESGVVSFVGEFCKAPSLCPDDSPSVIPYSTTISHTKGYTLSSFRLKVVDPVVTGTYYSNNIRVYCNDCSQNFAPTVVSFQVSQNPSC